MIKAKVKIEKLEVRYHDLPVGMLSLDENGLCLFEYDPQWLKEGFSISPLELPFKDGVFKADPTPFNGNFGVFEDSLPDGYGRYLLSKTLKKEGVDIRSLSELDLLSIVGEMGMGALCFYPATSLEMDPQDLNFDLLQKKALEVLKEKQDDDAELLLFNSGNSGGARPKAVFTDEDGHWLVKFRHTYDPKEIGVLEYKYNLAARECGINVPDFKLINQKYFASRRFDLKNSGERLHTVTAGGLLGVSLSMPILDYDNLLGLTGYITQNPEDVEEMYKRMIFNYLTENKDDHCKNFSFYVTEEEEGRWKWRLAPAYDLTLCTEGYNGEHATSVNGTGKPTLNDFIAVGQRIRISERRCHELIDQVVSGCGSLIRYRL